MTNFRRVQKHQKKYTKVFDTGLVIFPPLLFIVTSLQFVRTLPKLSLETLAPLLFALTFALVLIREFKLIRKSPIGRIFYIKRHASRIILAFGFAIMAVLRIGVKLDFLGLAFTTLLPMLLALIASLLVEKRISKNLPS